MSETDVIPREDTQEARRDRDRVRLKKVALRHGTALLAALTLWGASDYWATGSGLVLAEVVSWFNAVFAGTAIAYLVHEWGHFAGARLSGSVSPVMKEPASFFMFSFKYEQNSREQFLSMSLGGPIANWSLVILLCFLLPLETWSQALLLATTFAIAVSVSVFEVPVINRVLYGDDPQVIIEQRRNGAGTTPTKVGIVAGALLWLLIA
ncbi:MAG: hypothetical protein HOC70_08510 [Gammaproteobacteria bacterium]|jgi:hypothetical protein|nr:hypothetical protein [Gammaproteobacteria bacterium]MBT4493275.1 hypothetical protein [Gammaproteobacteria bacterium]MBT7372039.1 hypothetical protein [Gammaproteobacteria bacterium]